MHPKVIESLEDILTHSQYIIDDTTGMTYEQFLENRTVRQAVERNLEVIGIAAVRIRDTDPDFYDDFESLRPAVAVRNRLAHGYDDDIDHWTLWGIIGSSLPTLMEQVGQQL